MPHQCVRCGIMYADGARELLAGCACGKRVFWYLRKEKLAQAQEMTKQLTLEQKEQMEKDVLDLVGVAPQEDAPVVLDFESIRLLKPGTYEIDLVHVFRKEPLVVKLEEGKYFIDIPQAFKKK